MLPNRKIKRANVTIDTVLLLLGLLVVEEKDGGISGELLMFLSLIPICTK